MFHLHAQPLRFAKLILIVSLSIPFLSFNASAEDTAMPNKREAFIPYGYPGEPKDPRCNMIPDKGPCKAIFFKYYYEHKTNSCKEFTYGGCDGVVPFDTKEECQNICGGAHVVPTIVKKPAIYFYPQKKSAVSVSLRINGSITKTVPSYSEGWNIIANPNGMIEGGYDYLFYEADLKKISLPKEGWVVEYQELNHWFDINLAKLGLNAKEKQQFKEYWMKELPSSPYYKIQLLDMKFLSDNMGLNIHPKPDTLIRLNFYFTPLKQLEKINEPYIKTPDRKGFTVVEWGGILDDSKTKKVR